MKVRAEPSRVEADLDATLIASDHASLDEIERNLKKLQHGGWSKRPAAPAISPYFPIP